MRLRKAGIYAVAVDEDLRAACRIARTLRYQGLVLDAMSPQLDLAGLSQSGRREISHLLRSHDLQPVAIRAHLAPRGLAAGADIDRQLSLAERAMQAAEGLHANLVLMDLRALPTPPQVPSPKPRITPEQAGLILLPSSQSPPPEPPSAPKVDHAALSLVQSVLEELGRRADRMEVRTGFSTGLSSFAALIHAIDSARCPWFGFDLNPVDALRDDLSIEEILSRVASRLFHVQAKDAQLGADRRTQPAPLGDGDVNWPLLLQRLDEADYTEWLSVDPTEQPDRLAAAREARSRL